MGINPPPPPSPTKTPSAEPGLHDTAGSTSRRPSGSRVGSRAAVQALQAFTSLVTLTLGDAHAQRLAEGEQAAAELSAVQALDALQKLAVQRPQEPQASAAGDNAGGRAVSVCGQLFAWCFEHACDISSMPVTRPILSIHDCRLKALLLPSGCELQELYFALVAAT